MEKKSYEILKFVARGDRCYVSGDCVEGKTIVKWLKYHPDIPKEQLYIWIREIIRQLEAFHKCRGNPIYQYLNPYSIIVTKDNHLYLLDLGSGNQEKILRQMQRKGIRESFLAPDNLYYQRASMADDIYGFGKTLQYILASSVIEPRLTRREEAKFQKIISKCLNQNSNKNYQNVSELSEYFPKRDEKKKSEKRTRKKRALLLAAAAFTVLTASAVVLAGNAQKESGGESKEEGTKELTQLTKEKQKEESKSEDKSEGEREETADGRRPPGFDEKEVLQFDMAMLYFLELRDYEKSRELFGQMEGCSIAGYYERLAGYMGKGHEDIVGRNLEQLLENIEEEMPDKDDIRYTLSLLRGYSLLTTKEAAGQKIRLGEQAIEIIGEMDTKDWSQEQEIREYLAAAYEQTEDVKKAEEQYEMLLEFTEGEKEREQLYQKLTLLYEESGQQDKALEVCKKGTEELSSSKMLRLLFIRTQCRMQSIDRQICAESIKGFLAEIPELVGEEEFKKLQQEYEIKVEGEQVWVGR